MLSFIDLYKKDFSLTEIDLFVRAGALIPVVKSGKQCFRVDEQIMKNVTQKY